MKAKNIIVCLALMLMAQALPAQNNAENLVRLLVGQLKNHKNMEMSFTYQISPDGKNLGDAQKGRVWLQGDAYRIEMVEQQIISDSKIIWTYLIEDEEVMVSNASEGEDNTPLKLLTSLDESYVASLTGIDAKGIATVELANPKGQYKRVTLKIDTTQTKIKSADIYAEDGSKLVVTVDEMKFDLNLDDKFFTFDEQAHPDVDVIDMR